MRPTIFLFDIDGTILDGGGVGRRAMQAAFAEVVGDTEALPRVRFSGMTDRAIVRAGLRGAGQPEDDAVIDAVLDRYLELLPEQIATAQRYAMHVGVTEAVDAALQLASSAVGLGTGNVKIGAQCKLEPLGIAGQFAFGGFGCDAEDRAMLLRIGAGRGAQQLGLPLEACRVLVIGDTPADVAAAHAIGARCLAVATGTYRLEQLHECGADWVVTDLRDPIVFGVLRDTAPR